MMSKEVGEDQTSDAIGRSTMAQEVNPNRTLRVLSVAARFRSILLLGLDGMQQRHEGQMAADQAMNEAVDANCPMVFELSKELTALILGLRVNRDRMEANLLHSGDALRAKRDDGVGAGARSRARTRFGPQWRKQGRRC